MDHIYPANSNEKDPLKSIKAASKATDNIEVEEDLANPEKQPVIRPRPQRVRLTRSNSLTTPASSTHLYSLTTAFSPNV